MRQHGERIWIGRDGHRYRVLLVRDRLCFGTFDTFEGRWLGSVAAKERDLPMLTRDELEALLQDARGRG